MSKRQRLEALPPEELLEQFLEDTAMLCGHCDTNRADYGLRHGLAKSAIAIAEILEVEGEDSKPLFHLKNKLLNASYPVDAMVGRPLIGKNKPIRELLADITPMVEAVLSRLKGKSAQGDDDVNSAKTQQVGMSKQARAIAVKAEHPDWTDKQIADAAGCNVKSLYRFPQFMAAKDILKQDNTLVPKGRKGKDEPMEAWENDKQ